MNQEICVNQVFYDHQVDDCFRVIWRDRVQDQVYIFRIGSGKTFPITMSLSEMEKAIRNGTIEEVKDVFLPNSMPSEDDKKVRDRIWEMMGDALTNEPDIFDRDKRSAMLSDIEEKYGIPRTNLYRHLRRYWKRGKTPDAFLPIHPKERKWGKGRKRGRKLKTPGRGIDLTERDLEHMNTVITTYYLSREKPTLESVYKRMLGEYYSIRTLQENGTIRTTFLPEEELPSFYQFRYYYRTHFLANAVVKAREGDAEYELNHRGTLHRADSMATGPGYEYQVDATVGDIYLVSSFNRSELIGRPVIYFVIDVFSRMVTGMYIGLEGPSWGGMMMALYNACTDKVSYCREYGIEISNDEWPCHHVPDRYIGDRGELLSHKSDFLVSSLGVRIDNTPPYRGDLKPYVERYFKTVNEYTSVLIPGTVKPDMKKRNGPDYRLDAKLTLYEFTRIMIRIVLDYNNHKVLQYYEPRADVVRADVDLVPIKLWQWGINNCGLLRIVPEKRVRFALMPRESGSIAKDGVRFKRLRYTCQAFEEKDLFAQAREKGVEKVSISYDPRNMARIYVWRDGEDEPYLCRLLDWEDKYCGKSKDEVTHELDRRRLQSERLKRTEEESSFNLDEFIQEEVDAAKEAYEASVPEMNKAERLKNMRANRARDKKREGEEKAFTGDRYDPEADPDRQNSRDGDADYEAAPAAGKVSPQMELIRAQVNARLQKMKEAEAAEETTETTDE